MAAAGATDTLRFDMRGSLGAGGMGTVYRAFDRRLGRDVALKMLRQVTGRDLYRFKREFRSLADIAHPNLVALHELHTTGDQWFFTMELLEGVPFFEWVRPGSIAPAPSSLDSETETPLLPAPRSRQEVAAAPLDIARLRAALPQ